MLKSLLLIMLCVMAICGSAKAEDRTVVASNYSDRYHSRSCKIAGQIPPEELLTFKSPAEAEAAGLMPCKKCHPSAVTSNLHAARSKSKPQAKN